MPSRTHFPADPESAEQTDLSTTDSDLTDDEAEAGPLPSPLESPRTRALVPGLQRFAPLIDLIFVDDVDFDIVAALASTIDLAENEPVAAALLAFATAELREQAMLRRLIGDDVKQNAARPQQILRQHTLASRAVGAHARRIGRAYLHMTLGQTIRKLLHDESRLALSMEVDPAKLKLPCDAVDADAVLARNRASLMRWADAIVHALSVDAEELPSGMRELCAELHACCERVGIASEQRTAIIGGYLVLRWINPAIVWPETSGLSAHAPSATARRGLVLISKLLQAASNGVAFGAKEPFMAPLNAFIERATPAMAAFIRRASGLKPLDDGSTTSSAVAPPKAACGGAHAETVRDAQPEASESCNLLKGSRPRVHYACAAAAPVEHPPGSDWRGARNFIDLNEFQAAQREAMLLIPEVQALHRCLARHPAVLDKLPEPLAVRLRDVLSALGAPQNMFTQGATPAAFKPVPRASFLGAVQRNLRTRTSSLPNLFTPSLFTQGPLSGKRREAEPKLTRAINSTALACARGEPPPPLDPHSPLPSPRRSGGFALPSPRRSAEWISLSRRSGDRGERGSRLAVADTTDGDRGTRRNSGWGGAALGMLQARAKSFAGTKTRPTYSLNAHL